jgi:DNA-binding NtrC family response regulator
VDASRGQNPARILLIEDDAAIARLTAILLQQEGYAVEMATGLQEALPLLAADAFDLVIADTERGSRPADLSGLAPLMTSAGARPVLLFSAHRFSTAQIDAAGLSGSIRKPYDVDDLLRTIRLALQEGGRS